MNNSPHCIIAGETSTSDWLQTVRHYPAPWAELEFDNIIISIPSEEVRSLDNPDTLATLWDKIMKGIAELAGIPHRFPRKERYVADVQISHGKCLSVCLDHLSIRFIYCSIYLTRRFTH